MSNFYPNNGEKTSFAQWGNRVFPDAMTGIRTSKEDAKYYTKVQLWNDNAAKTEDGIPVMDVVFPITKASAPHSFIIQIRGDKQEKELQGILKSMDALDYVHMDRSGRIRTLIYPCISLLDVPPKSMASYSSDRSVV